MRRVLATLQHLSVPRHRGKEMGIRRHLMRRVSKNIIVLLIWFNHGPPPGLEVEPPHRLMTMECSGDKLPVQCDKQVQAPLPAGFWDWPNCRGASCSGAAKLPGEPKQSKREHGEQRAALPPPPFGPAPLSPSELLEFQRQQFEATTNYMGLL